nr:ArsB/NhaD family transporter [Kofleriaceae bacterium]
MIPAIAFGTLATTVGLAVGRPRVGSFRFTPGTAAIIGVAILLCTGVLSVGDVAVAMTIQSRPLLTLVCIMVMTGVVQEVGAFDRLAAKIEARARTRSAAYTFTIVFVVSVITPSLLNNDAAILILTPLVVAVVRRLYARDSALARAFAFAVFLAPGVAPFIVSNPMNMIVAEFAGLDFNSYAAVMVPISLAGAALTYVVLRGVFRRVLANAVPTPAPAVTTVHRHAAERPAVALLVVVFLAYPVAASFGIEIWLVALVGALGSLAIGRVYQVASMPRLLGHVSLDILAFLWGIFLVVRGLENIGVVDWVASLYAQTPVDSAAHVATVGVTSAVGSAIIDNHPMSLLNMLAIGGGDHHGKASLLAALVGGDIGPRLLPIGSLAGLLWMDLLRRAGVQIRVREFVRVGTLVLLPTLALSLAMLALMR